MYKRMRMGLGETSPTCAAAPSKRRRGVLFFHRRAASARFAAIPTWLRRWAVGALGARPDAYTLRRIAGALVLLNGLCHARKRGHCAAGTLLRFLSR